MLAMCECLRVLRGSESLILPLCCPFAKRCQTHYERPVSGGLLRLLQNARDVSLSVLCVSFVWDVSARGLHVGFSVRVSVGGLCVGSLNAGVSWGFGGLCQAFLGEVSL